ncbi:MAG: FAD-binding oxidoreductase [Myxococcales bacterium]|nr:FAD-binding oxidoreductase [Myxococcales bacterium]MCB9581735.1 FAD-binding oxidoreductase [Polyangiaceae bacterium]
MDLTRELAHVVPGARVSAAPSDRIAYARDLWPRRLIEVRAGRPAEHPPRAVVWPRSTDEVARVVRYCHERGIPIVPFGAGSGVCGAVEPDASVVIDLKDMAGFHIDAEAPLIDVEPGAMGITLEEDIQARGFTIGHFPSSILCSTVGGWLAARGAGQCSGLYGKIEDMVVSAECVLGDGEVVELQRRFGGPNMVPLVIGSEGTLGVITRTKLRLHRAPAARAYGAFSFPTIEAGWDALRVLFQAGLRPAVARLYDPIDSALMRQGTVKAPVVARPQALPKKRSTRLVSVLRNALRAPRALNAVIEAAEGNLLGGCTLVLVFEGESEAAHSDLERATLLCRELDGALLGEGPARRWFQHRYGVSYRQSPVFRLGAFSDTMEVAAPWSRLADLYDGVRHALGEHVLVMAHLSHAYPDGCSIYFTFSGVGKDDDDALAIYERAWRDALGAAIAAGGTLSHHHGVGRSKAPRLGEELGFGVELIRRVMRAWDPAGICNPGALTPREDGPAPQATPPPTLPQIDEHSLLARFSGDTPLGVAHELLARSGLELGLSEPPDPSLTIARFIAEGLPGAPDPWSDPVAQPIAGFDATLSTGEQLSVRPSPRRAVGPDLSSLFVGAREAVGSIDGATLTVRRRGAPAARQLPFHRDRHPKLEGPEQNAWERLVRAAHKK